MIIIILIMTMRTRELVILSRPPFEVIEIWLESLVMHLSGAGAITRTLLADIQQYAHGAMQRDHGTPGACPGACPGTCPGTCPGSCAGYSALTRATSRVGSDDPQPDDHEHIQVSIQIHNLYYR